MAFVPGSTTLAIASGNRPLLWNYRIDRLENNIEVFSGNDIEALRSRINHLYASGAWFVLEGTDVFRQGSRPSVCFSYFVSTVAWKLAAGKIDD